MRFAMVQSDINWYSRVMAGHEKESPERFARLVSAAIRREMGDRRMSGRALGRRLGKSEKYARDRLNDVFEFSLNDIENFCLFIGVNPETFIARIESDVEFQRAFDSTDIEPALRQVRAKPLKEVLGEDGVGGTDDDPTTKTDAELKAAYRLAADHSDAEQDLDERTP
jgi:hypothetical protein